MCMPPDLNRPFFARTLRALSLLTLLSLAACSFEPASFSEIRCENEGEQRDGATCQDGFWVAPDDLDIGTPDADADLPDTDVDLPDTDTDLPDTDTGCEPPTEQELCEDAVLSCGPLEVVDRCGAQRAISCGSCEDDELCEGGVCVCQPEENDAFCTRLAADCGTVIAPDNCGDERTVSCGDCQEGYLCGEDNRCTCPGETVSELCEQNSLECGTRTVVDGCGQTREINCDSCTGTGESCTLDNLCVCTPLSEEDLCELESAQCGPLTVTDNCGEERTLNCGGCTGTGESCTQDNQCHCPPQSQESFCADNAAECGEVTAPNNCGDIRPINCGTCTGTGESCSLDNQCVCNPLPDETFCTDEGAQCGTITITDNCGETRPIECGECPNNGDICNENNQCEACQPQSDEEICQDQGAECGTIVDHVDNCGTTRQIDCGGSNACNGQNVCAPDLTCCQPESDETLCAASPYRCDQHTVTDSCGQQRTLKCYTCRYSACEDNPDGPGQCCHYPTAGTCWTG
ncbi:hypothetical protein FRC98_07340 [Lujinxingia vulgaris]|uniref:Uncharacterized protein n=1 Tax=Lujinxingia vulgaris TaxID=2600176 RepID=A0A5C6XIT5_9DELT|nr:hypothetical protein [Lujinxingia vulgaris]TXD37499.1 hypothetical protein FRC98_07340 [Lujinxingia vulgaris]